MRWKVTRRGSSPKQTRRLRSGHVEKPETVDPLTHALPVPLYSGDNHRNSLRQCKHTRRPIINRKKRTALILWTFFFFFYHVLVWTLIGEWGRAATHWQWLQLPKLTVCSWLWNLWCGRELNYMMCYAITFELSRHDFCPCLFYWKREKNDSFHFHFELMTQVARDSGCSELFPYK